jgi:Cu+-exporting ATPase
VKNSLKLSLPIEGMTCASCVRRVEKAAAAVPGVQSAAANLATERLDVTLAQGAGSDAVIAAIRKAGYGVSSVATELAIEGMTCASCVRRAEKAIAAVPGVLSASVNLASERASITLLPSAETLADVESAIRKAGYEPHRLDTSAAAPRSREETRAAERQALMRDLIIAGLLTAPVFAIEMAMHAVPAFHHWLAAEGFLHGLAIAEFLLSGIVLFGPGLRFFRKGIPALLHFAPDMNALVILGASAAFGYSTVATFLPSLLPSGTANVYFEASAVIVTLILLGRYLEARAKGRTSDAIRKLIGLQPTTARILRNGVAMEVPVGDVQRADVIDIRPGERLPVDGTVEGGASYVDESMVTGEPVPVLRATGANVIGGTINTTGSFTYRATRVGADTLLAQIIRMVEHAQGAKLPIQAMVDRITGWFVPAVIAAAALTFLVWLLLGPEPALGLALVNAVAVLIIACPCAMGLATPTSIMVGTGRAAELGILFRKGDALQTLRDATVIAFDKTGTLTEGRPRLTDLQTVNGFSRQEVLALAAAVESRSEHPIATAIVTAARTERLDVPAVAEFEALPGLGATGTVLGRQIAVGAGRYMERLAISPAVLAAEAARIANEGKSPLFVAVDGRLAAALAVADPVKPSTPGAIKALQDLGLKLVMLTGDNRDTAAAIATSLGMDEVVAEVLPGGKVDALRKLKADGQRVAFVGDGINDAPALAAADTGIAIGTGTDIAIESADVVLMSGDLQGIVTAVGMSRAVIRNIGQNLFWAFAYNVVLIPVAAGVLYPVSGTLLSPMLAAGAMALSSVFVVSNALRLRRYMPILTPGA